MIVLIAGQIADVAKELEGRLPKRRRADFEATLKAQRALRGHCVDDATGLKILRPVMAGQPVLPPK